MIETDRVALVACIWFAVLTSAGDAIGHWTGNPGTGLCLGFLFALATLPAWPWVIPCRLDDWMHDLPPDGGRRHLWSRTWGVRLIGSRNRDMGRVALVGAIWFAFWMLLAAGVGAWLGKPSTELQGAYAGFFNGAWLALLTSFAWPWIMPEAVDRWMYRSELG